MISKRGGSASVALVQEMLKLVVTTSAGMARGGRAQLRSSDVRVITLVDTIRLTGAASAIRGKES